MRGDSRLLVYQKIKLKLEYKFQYKISSLTKFYNKLSEISDIVEKLQCKVEE